MGENLSQDLSVSPFPRRGRYSIPAPITQASQGESLEDTIYRDFADEFNTATSVLTARMKDLRPAQGETAENLKEQILGPVMEKWNTLFGRGGSVRTASSPRVSSPDSPWKTSTLPDGRVVQVNEFTGEARPVTMGGSTEPLEPPKRPFFYAGSREGLPVAESRFESGLPPMIDNAGLGPLVEASGLEPVRAPEMDAPPPTGYKPTLSGLPLIAPKPSDVGLPTPNIMQTNGTSFFQGAPGGAWHNLPRQESPPADLTGRVLTELYRRRREETDPAEKTKLDKQIKEIEKGGRTSGASTAPAGSPLKFKRDASGKLVLQ